MYPPQVPTLTVSTKVIGETTVCVSDARLMRSYIVLRIIRRYVDLRLYSLVMLSTVTVQQVLGNISAVPP